jgi:hypothetical protein
MTQGLKLVRSTRISLNIEIVLFDVSVQVHSQRTPADDVNLIFDFNSAILIVKEQAVVELTNP